MVIYPRHFKELNTVLKSLGGYPSEETINKMMIEYDDDGNEVIDFDEFIKMIVKVEVTNYS